jgi:hypothetical protein
MMLDPGSFSGNMSSPKPHLQDKTRLDNNTTKAHAERNPRAPRSTAQQTNVICNLEKRRGECIENTRHFDQRIMSSQRFKLDGRGHHKRKKISSYK